MEEISDNKGGEGYFCLFSEISSSKRQIKWDFARNPGSLGSAPNHGF